MYANMPTTAPMIATAASMISTTCRRFKAPYACASEESSVSFASALSPVRSMLEATFDMTMAATIIMIAATTTTTMLMSTVVNPLLLLASFFPNFVIGFISNTKCIFYTDLLINTIHKFVKNNTKTAIPYNQIKRQRPSYTAPAHAANSRSAVDAAEASSF